MLPPHGLTSGMVDKVLQKQNKTFPTMAPQPARKLHLLCAKLVPNGHTSHLLISVL